MGWDDMARDLDTYNDRWADVEYERRQEELQQQENQARAKLRKTLHETIDYLDGKYFHSDHLDSNDCYPIAEKLRHYAALVEVAADELYSATHEED